jgi:hypothetical protein
MQAAEDKAAIDALEAALKSQYINESGADIIDRSVDFGRAVAQKIVDWAETDGYQRLNDPYSPPHSGGQYWTPPASAGNSCLALHGRSSSNSSWQRKRRSSQSSLIMLLSLL